MRLFLRLVFLPYATTLSFQWSAPAMSAPEVPAGQPDDQDGRGDGTEAEQGQLEPADRPVMHRDVADDGLRDGVRHDGRLRRGRGGGRRRGMLAGVDERPGASEQDPQPGYR